VLVTIYLECQKKEELQYMNENWLEEIVFVGDASPMYTYVCTWLNRIILNSFAINSNTSYPVDGIIYACQK